MTWDHPLLAEKLEAFPILRPDAAEDIPLARFLLGLLTGSGRCVLDPWDRRISCSECPFYDSILSCPLAAPFCYSYTRALLPSTPYLLVCWTLPSLLSRHVLAHDTDDSVASPFHSPQHHHTYILPHAPPFTSPHKFFNLRLCPT